MTRRIALLLACVALAAAAGCSKRHTIHIESNTCWSGSVNGDQNINDCGNATYKVIGTLRCVRVKVNTTTGFVRVQIDDHPWANTPDAYGVVQACE